MILRSQHNLSKTADGHEAWRSQSMPVVHRQVLSRLREPMTVHDLMERLPNMDRSEITAGIAALASKGWVLVEEPDLRAETHEEQDMGEQAPEPVDALTDLMSRRPPAAAPLDLDEAITSAPVSPTDPSSLPVEGEDSEVKVPHVPVPTGPVFDRGTPEQERALMIDMGLLSADAPYHGGAPASSFERVEDVSDDFDDAPVTSLPSAPAASPAPAKSSAESKSIDPRREEVLRRIGQAAANHRETRQALRENKARQAAEQMAADEQARRNRELEEAEHKSRKK